MGSANTLSRRLESAFTSFNLKQSSFKNSSKKSQALN